MQLQLLGVPGFPTSHNVYRSRGWILNDDAAVNDEAPIIVRTVFVDLGRTPKLAVSCTFTPNASPRSFAWSPTINVKR